MQLEFKARNLLLHALARRADNVPGLTPQQYLRGLLARSGVPERVVREFGGTFTGNADYDAGEVVRITAAQGPNPARPEETILGSVLLAALDGLNLEDTAAVVAVIETSGLVFGESLRRLRQGFQIPIAQGGDGIPEHGPDLRLDRPGDVELQAFLPRGTVPLLDVGFLRAALIRSAAVCRVEIDGTDVRGTGFFVGQDVVLTACHVLDYDNSGALEQHARAATIRLGAWSAVEGQVSTDRVYRLADPPLLAWSPVAELDFVAMRVDAAVLSDRNVGVLTLEPRPPALRSALHILQHPGGEEMKLAASADGVSAVDSTRGLLQYVTPAKGGSSGAPCFDDRWKVVALHRAERATLFGSVREGILVECIYPKLRAWVP